MKLSALGFLDPIRMRGANKSSAAPAPSARAPTPAVEEPHAPPVYTEIEPQRGGA